MRIRTLVLGILGLVCATGTGSAGIFDLFHCGCRDECNRCTTTITSRPYNAFSPVCCGSFVCDGCCPFPMGMAGGGHGHGGHLGGHNMSAPAWSPCCPTPSFGGMPGGCSSCGTTSHYSTAHYMPPAAYYPWTSYYPPVPVPPTKGHGHGPQGHGQQGPPPQGAHTSHYQGYYPQAYGYGYGYGYYPASYMPNAGYWPGY